MNNLELNRLMNEYLKVSKEEAELKSRKSELKDQILNMMGDEKEYNNGYIKATISVAEGFDYNDEVSVINKLKQFGYGRFVLESVDTKSVNSFLKNHPDNPLTESLFSSYDISKNSTTRLSVKEV